LRGGLEHLKIEKRLIDESFASVMSECDLGVIGAPSIFKTIRSAAASVRIKRELNRRLKAFPSRILRKGNLNLNLHKFKNRVWKKISVFGPSQFFR
jgi:hypothetical protein